MQTARRPYWSWSLDRWNLLVAILLAVLLVVVNARLGGEPARWSRRDAGVRCGAGSRGAAAAGRHGDAGFDGEGVRRRDRGGETTVGADGTWQWRCRRWRASTAWWPELRADGTEQATTEPLVVTVTERGGRGDAGAGGSRRRCRCQVRRRRWGAAVAGGHGDAGFDGEGVRRRDRGG